MKKVRNQEEKVKWNKLFSFLKRISIETLYVHNLCEVLFEVKSNKASKEAGFIDEFIALQ
ncbi:hypothetical protein [Litoribacillus peritrichatus]|uniref:Uncharacterized protein n=1 Tax=Litoribacillus peritrichatus TaxID=718191 RepID=A0ABP7MZW1_9GAMM